MQRALFVQKRKNLWRGAMLLLVFLGIDNVSLAADSPTQNGTIPTVSMKTWRKPAADRKRRIILNNDVGRKSIRFTGVSFLAYRRRKQPAALTAA